MNQKQKSMKMHMLFCLMQLLLEALDELKVTSPRMIKLKSDMTDMCELMNEECKDTYTIQKTTYFNTITKKIETIMRKEFNEKM